jgi:hypothetical protein
MFELLINAFNVQALTKLFAAVAAAATVLTLAMPLVFVNPLDKRMRAVALEREKIRQRERERLAQENQRITLREAPSNTFKLLSIGSTSASGWVRKKHVSGLYRLAIGVRRPMSRSFSPGWRPQSHAFCLPWSTCFLYSNSINLPRSKLASALLPLMSGCSCRSYCSRIRSSADSCL